MEIPPPDDAAHEDGRLLHDMSVVNTAISRYILRFFDADAGRVEPISVTEELSLADKLTGVADRLRGRSDRRTSGVTQQSIPGEERD